MKIAIVGAGIIGVTTAYELAADGHSATARCSCHVEYACAPNATR